MRVREQKGEEEIVPKAGFDLGQIQHLEYCRGFHKFYNRKPTTCDPIRSEVKREVVRRNQLCYTNVLRALIFPRVLTVNTRDSSVSKS